MKNKSSQITGVLVGAAVFAALFATFFAPNHASAQASKGTVTGATPLIPSIQGPDLYKAYCASCHGADAKGKGPVAASMKVQPSDLTRISIRNRGVFPLQHIEKVISGEEQSNVSHGVRGMPVWGPVFSQVTDDRDLGRVRIDNLARYLRDIQEMK